jgi:hypothetical protein
VLTPLIAPSCNTHFQALLLSFGSSSKATKIELNAGKGKTNKCKKPANQFVRQDYCFT